MFGWFVCRRRVKACEGGRASALHGRVNSADDFFEGLSAPTSRCCRRHHCYRCCRCVRVARIRVVSPLHPYIYLRICHSRIPRTSSITNHFLLAASQHTACVLMLAAIRGLVHSSVHSFSRKFHGFVRLHAHWFRIVVTQCQTLDVSTRFLQIDTSSSW